MFSKLCPKCNRRSYSSSPEGEWLCPYCNTDLQHLPAGPPIPPAERPSSKPQSIERR